MGIRQKLWLYDSVKGTELPTSCISLLKHEKEFCGFLKNVKVPSEYSMNVLRLISFLDLKVAPSVKSHDYHVLLMQMIAVEIQNILPINVWEFIMNFCFFFNAIGQKVLSEEALESLERRHYETLCFLEKYFPPAFFDINVHFTTHFIKEIKLLCPLFLHQMYVKDRTRRPEGGEWESIKIPRGNSTYILKLTRHPSLLTRPRLHSYRKAIGPQNRVKNYNGNMNCCWQEHVRD
jgi:hypothetical protein